MAAPLLQPQHTSGRGYIGARTDITQQSGQTPDKGEDIYHITIYVSGYIETDTTGMPSTNNGLLPGANKVGAQVSQPVNETATYRV